MKITPPSTPPPATGSSPGLVSRTVAPVDVAASLLARFNPGQSLTATVAGPNSNGLLPLNIDGKLLEVTSTLQLMAGMQLKLRIDKGASGELLLRLLEPPLPAERQQALRRDLPRQSELKPLFEALATLAVAPPATPSSPAPTQSPNPATPDLGQLLHRAAQRLMQSLPEPRQLAEPRGVKQALHDSGLLFEHKLSQGDSRGLERDLKGQLLRLLGQLASAPRIPPPIAPATRGAQQPQSSPAAQGRAAPPPTTATINQGNKAPPQGTGQGSVQSGSRAAASEQLIGLLQGLIRQGESALARVQLNQLQNLTSSEADNPEWLLEMPVRHAQNQLETVKLRIHRERGGRNGERGEEQWNIRLELEDGQGGPLQVAMGLTRERVRVDLRAENGEVAEALSSHLGDLEKRLRARGLEVGHIAAHRGLGDDEPPPRPDGLLREEA